MRYKPDKTALARKNLERRLAPLRSFEAMARPARGWIKALRDALGMTTKQLATRIGVSQPRVIALEKAEAGDTITLATLRQAAAAMGCTLVYALVPNKPLDEMMRDRAREIADKQLTRTHRTMTLENQALDTAGLKAERERLIEELMKGDPRRLWDAS